MAAIVTPLGLYERIAPASSTDLVSFVYVSDDSAFGAGTPARSSRGYNFSRICDFRIDSTLQLCPYDSYSETSVKMQLNYTLNKTVPVEYYSLAQSISPILIDRYQSGIISASPSLSNFFDIQYRQWSIWSDVIVKDNGTLLTRAYKWLSSIVMNNKYELFEGIIADTMSGGVGFRNHSVPSFSLQYGFEWEEDILWMEPDTKCVDSNLTSKYVGTTDGYLDRSAELVDRGGFANIAKPVPFPDSSDWFPDGQRQPMLYERAYWMAWYTNVQAMYLLNITDPGTNRSRISSKLGQQFRVNSTFTRVTPQTYFNLERSDMFYTLVASAPASYAWNSSTHKFGSLNPNPELPNPHNMTNDYFSQAGLLIAGYGGGDPLNISTIAVKLGGIMSPPRLISREDPNNLSSIATYERSLYVCASATKVSIKTVRFRYNGTQIRNLKNLEVLNVKDKDYTGKPLPLWGSETPWMNETRTWNISNINTLWGLVNEADANNRNVTGVRSYHFYLPASDASSATIGYTTGSAYKDFVAGSTAPADNWGSIYGSDTDYHGDNVQVSFFQEMTKNATAAEKLLNLFWTDYATNYMVGTRGLHLPRYKRMLDKSGQVKRSTDSVTVQDGDVVYLADGFYPVHVLQRELHYRWAFGIPAIICVAITGIAILLALIGLIFGNASIARLRGLMYNISTGRVLAAYVYPEQRHLKDAETKEWIASVGHKQIRPYVLVSGTEHTGWAGDWKSQSYVRIEQRDEMELGPRR